MIGQLSIFFLVSFLSLFIMPIASAVGNPVVPNGKFGEFRHGTFPSPPIGDFTHVGVDIVAPCGSNIYSFADGQVKDIIDKNNDTNFSTLGYMVLIEHPVSLIGQIFYTLYLHMQNPPDVKIGDQVKGGSTIIGNVGDTGKTFGCHTHFEIRYFPERFSTWGNIYGPGDQRDSEYFKQNWEDPIKFFKKYPEGITLSRKQEALSAPVYLTMKDGSIFTGIVMPDVAKFKTKYGEIEVNIDTITSFNKGVLILNDQSKLTGDFTDGNITIRTSYTKLSLPISEIVAFSAEAATTPSQETSVSTQGTKSTVKGLSRDKAKEILNNLVITNRWCAFPGKCPNNSIRIPNVYGFYLEASSAGIEVSRETLLSYLSCLENKGFVKNLSVKKGRKKGFSGWDAWFETTTTGEPWQLTEMGQKYLTDNLDYSLQVVVDKITGIQFSNEDTIAKVFFDATTKIGDNPFNKCFDDFFDVHSLLNEPYALFELYDDGWRVKEWHSGGKLKERVQPSTKQAEKTTASAHTDKSNLILGSWKDEDSVMEYFRDGTFISNAYTGKRYTGTWSIEGNSLRLQFINPIRVLSVYTIIEMTDFTYKIKLNDHDKHTSNAKRLEPIKQSSSENNIDIAKNKIKQTSVYTTKSSRTYHKRNCSELNTTDLIEFSSPQEAESSGAIPCKNCNQLAGGHKNESNQNKQKEEIHAEEPFRTDTNKLITKTTNLTRETATEILKNSKYFPRYRTFNLPIGNSVNVEGLIKSAMAVNYEMGQELSVGYGCAKRLGHLLFVGRKRNIFGTQFAPLYNVSVTRDGMKYGNVINSEAFGYRKQYAYHIYRTNVYKVTGIRRINQSSSEVEFIYRADNIGQVARCVHPNITPDKTESVGQAMFTLFDDGWRVDTVKVKD